MFRVIFLLYLLFLSFDSVLVSKSLLLNSKYFLLSILTLKFISSTSIAGALETKTHNSLVVYIKALIFSFDSLVSIPNSSIEEIISASLRIVFIISLFNFILPSKVIFL